MSSRPFAVFDIDGTLIRWQLFHAVVNELGKSGLLRPGDHEAIHAARMEWKNRTTNHGFVAYEKTLVKSYLASLQGLDYAKYLVCINNVFEEFKDQTFTYTRDLLRRLKDEGYLLFAISGSQAEIVQKLAEYHGFDDAIGAESPHENGLLTGVVSTPIHDKRAALEQLVAKHGATYENSYAVGDSPSDVAMLEAATHPIAFNPDRGLYETAKKHGWSIVVERKNVVYELGLSNDIYTLR